MAGCSKAHADKVKVHFTVSLIILVSKTKLQTGDGSFWNQLIDAELQAAPHPTPKLCIRTTKCKQHRSKLQG